MYSSQTAKSDGTLTRLDLSLDYINKDDIFVYVDDVLLPTSTYSWTWVGNNVIQFNTPIAANSNVNIRRLTPLDRMYHIFSVGGAIFKDKSVDENFRQLLYQVQEFSEGSVLTDLWNDLNMHGFRVRNLGTPTDSRDAITLGWYQADKQGIWEAYKRFSQDILVQSNKLNDIVIAATEQADRAVIAAETAESFAATAGLYDSFPISSADVAIESGLYYTRGGVPTSDEYQVTVIKTDDQIIQTATSGDGIVWTRSGTVGELHNAEWVSATADLGDVAYLDKTDLMVSENLTVLGGKTQSDINRQWIDVGYRLTGDVVADTALVLSCIAEANATGKGIRCAAYRTGITLNGDIDFSGIRHIDWQTDIVVPTGTVIIGGLAGGVPVDIQFRAITNGTSTVIGAIPSRDTFRIFGIKAGVVKVGGTNLLRIHADGSIPSRNSNAYFTLNLTGAVRAFRVSDVGTGGWNNNITILGGRIIDLNVTGTGYTPNELTFDYNTFEGELVRIYFKNAWSNRIQNARFENTSTSSGVIFAADSMQNTVIQRWSGSGSTRGQFSFAPPVTDLGVGNMCTTQSLTEFDSVEIFNVTPSMGIAGNAVSVDSIVASLGSAPNLTDDTGVLQIDLNAPTINIKSIYVPIVMTEMLEVKNGDACVIEADYAGALFRPIIYVYDANKNRIASLPNDGILLPSATYNADTGSYSVGTNLTVAALRVGFSVNHASIRYIRVGLFNTTTNAAFRSMSARLFTQKLGRGASRTQRRSTSNLILNGEVTFSDVPTGTTYLNSQTGLSYYSSSQIETSMTATVNNVNTIVVRSAAGIEVGTVLGINVSGSGITAWRTVTAISGRTVTLSATIVASAGARVVGNTWKPLG